MPAKGLINALNRRRKSSGSQPNFKILSLIILTSTVDFDKKTPNHTKYPWYVYSCTAEGVLAPAISGGFWRASPRRYFLVFFKKVTANLVRYMQVLTLSSRHARAPVHRRPCCRSLKAGCILKYNTQW